MKKLFIDNGGGKMKHRKIAYSLLFVLSSMFMLGGCGNVKVEANYDSQVNVENVPSQVVAENQTYELEWDDKSKCVLLTDKATGETWSDVLYEAISEGSSSANAKSAITVTVVNETNLNWETFACQTELGENGKMVCEKTDNGVTVTYYFDRFQIAIPVVYELREDSLAVSIDGTKIQEGDTEYKLVSVGVTPYFCSASNSDENYLFVPSGQGALMYTAENADGTRKYSSEVYGTDAARQVLKSTSENEEVRLPVFGAKDGDVAVLGIIEQGAESAFIEAQAGYARLGYSQVGATFYFRGFDTFRHGTYATGNAVMTRTSTERSTEKMTVAYYPLQGEKADYNGMANRYREYLLDNELLKKTEIQNSPYSVTLLGGTTVSKSFFGVPYKSLASMTTFEEAKQIITGLTQDNQVAPVVRMMNYGDNGLMPGTIAGGKKYDSIFGNKKQLEDLQASCKDADATLFWDSDVVRYDRSGNGFGINSNCAKTAIHYQATINPVTPIRSYDEDISYRIIGRNYLSDVVDKVIKKADTYGHEGLSFSSLGELAFSDFGKTSYIMKANMGTDVSELLQKAGEERVIAVAGANAYAACVSDALFDITNWNGDYDVLDESIPFYQMVFHGSKPLYSTAVNLSENIQKEVMLCAASGTGLGFTLSSEYVPETNDAEFYKLYGTLHKNNQALIKQALSDYQFALYYEKVADSTIVKYEILENGVSATHYENGVILYANHGSEAVETPVGVLEGYMFKVQ